MNALLQLCPLCPALFCSHQTHDLLKNRLPVFHLYFISPTIYSQDYQIKMEKKETQLFSWTVFYTTYFLISSLWFPAFLRIKSSTYFYHCVLNILLKCAVLHGNYQIFFTLKHCGNTVFFLLKNNYQLININLIFLLPYITLTRALIKCRVCFLMSA